MPGKTVHIALKVKDLESSTRFYEDVFGFRKVTTHDGGNGHVSRHLTDGTIDLALVVYESENAKEATLSGPGPCIHHSGAEVDDIKVAAEKIKKLGGEIFSPLNAGVVKFRAPDGTIAELVQKDRYREPQEIPWSGLNISVDRAVPCRSCKCDVDLPLWHRPLKGAAWLLFGCVEYARVTVRTSSSTVLN